MFEGHQSINKFDLDPIMANVNEINMHSRVMRVMLLGLVLAALLSGCAGMKHGEVPLADEGATREAQSFSVPKGMANVYVFFSGGYSSSFRNFPVNIDGVLKGFVSDGTFIRIPVAPGERMLITSGQENQQIIKFVAVEGNSHFFELRTEIGWKDLNAKLVEVSPEIGRKGVLASKMVR